MGMETLNSAARAAGFAMAASDEPHADIKPEVKVADAQWRPGEAILRHADAAHRPGADWFKGVLSLLGRRAPA